MFALAFRIEFIPVVLACSGPGQSSCNALGLGLWDFGKLVMAGSGRVF